VFIRLELSITINQICPGRSLSRLGNLGKFIEKMFSNSIGKRRRRDHKNRIWHGLVPVFITPDLGRITFDTRYHFRYENGASLAVFRLIRNENVRSLVLVLAYVLFVNHCYSPSDDYSSVLQKKQYGHVPE